MKRVAETEHKPVVSVPEVVRLAIVAVEPATVLIVLHVEDVQVTVRIAECIECLLCHYPLNARRAVVSLASTTRPSTLYQVASFL